MKTPPYSWLKKIHQTLVEMDEIPLLKLPGAFRLDDLTNALSQKLTLPNLKIVSSEILWRTDTEQLEGLGENTVSLHFLLTPLSGTLSWILSKEDLSKCCALLLKKHFSPSGFSSDLLQEGFYRYVTLELLSLLEELKTFPGLSPQIVENPSPAEGGALCMDIQISLENHSFWGRLCLSPSFQKSWVRHYSQSPSSFLEELKQVLEIDLAAEVGFCQVTMNQLESLQVGDFILCDTIQFDPKTEKGTAILSLGGNPLFHAKIKQTNLKILDFALYHEENTMTKNDDVEKNEPPEEILEGEEDLPEEEPPVVEKVPTEEEKLSLLKDIPVSLTLEVARIKMTMEKLLQLQPGNLLELPVSTQQGISLTVNGKKIGKGELVYLGDTLGVRVLEIG